MKWFALALFTLVAWAQEADIPEHQVPPELGSPRATMQTFLTAMLSVKQDDHGALAQAVDCLDLSGGSPPSINSWESSCSGPFDVHRSNSLCGL